MLIGQPVGGRCKVSVVGAANKCSPKVIADHFEKILPIYRKQILKMIADHF
jgi:hypothetical protein